MSNNAVGVIYHQLHHFLTEATWDAQKVNERKLQVMQQFVGWLQENSDVFALHLANLGLVWA